MTVAVGARMRHVYRKQGGWNSLTWAADEGHAKCVRVLMEAGANMELKTNVRDL